MSGAREFDALIEEAERRPFVGWDVSCDGRIRTTPPWDFAAMVAAQARRSPDLLDLGTGGGEWLSRLPHRPPCTVATEGWAPNVPVARDRLEPLGIEVIAVDAAPDNVDQDGAAGGVLPIPDGDFHLVTSRHESYVPGEVRRVLAPGGIFLTQQVASGAADDFCRLLDTPVPPGSAAWNLDFAVRQLEEAGFAIEEAAEGCEMMAFADVGALAWYLKNLPFLCSRFSIGAAREALERVHRSARRGRPVKIRQPLFR